jgi:hypothetical protein
MDSSILFRKTLFELRLLIEFTKKVAFSTLCCEYWTFLIGSHPSFLKACSFQIGLLFGVAFGGGKKEYIY